MAYRFVHTADLHLDSPLRSLAMRNPDLSELVGDATRQALINIVDLCLAEQVDALVIAGDLFDGDQTSMKTARFLAGQMARLNAANIRVFKIRGNHDNLSRISKQLIYPDNVTLFGGRAHVIVHSAKGRDVAFHGLSFAGAKVQESLLPKFLAPHDGAINVGIMHTSLAGAPGHDVYAPCSVADLHNHGFTYWALGHIHARSVDVGRSTVVMPGTPQARDIGESGPKSATLVTICDDGSIKLEARETAVAQFERVPVDVSNTLEWWEVVESIRHSLSAARDAVNAPHLIVRLHLKGATPLAYAISRDRDLLLAEAEEAAMQAGSCWIEKLEVSVLATQSSIPAGADPIIELAETMREAVRSQVFRANAKELVLKLVADLPPEARKFAGNDEVEFEAFVDSLLVDGSDAVISRLKRSAVE